MNWLAHIASRGLNVDRVGWGGEVAEGGLSLEKGRDGCRSWARWVGKGALGLKEGLVGRTDEQKTRT